MTRCLSLLFCQITLILVLSTLSVVAQSPVDGTTPSGIAAGTPSGSYSLSDLDNVNLYNGNLSFQLPLAQIDGRGNAKTTLLLSMNSAHWVVDKQPRERGGFNFTPKDISGLRPSAGNVLPPLFEPARMVAKRGMFGVFQLNTEVTTLIRMVVILSDGSEHELHDQLTGGRPIKTIYPGNTGPPGPSRGTIFVANDGSGLTFISDVEIRDYNGPSTGLPNGMLMFPDGTKYRFDSGDVQWIRDRNGNKLTFSYSLPAKLTEVRDSLNRAVTITYSDFPLNDPPTVPYDQITFTGFGGASRSIKIWYSRLGAALRSGYSLGTFASLFPGISPQGIVGTYNPFVVQAVELPDGRKYQFFYNPYKELARVELPTGAALEYEYTPSGQDITPRGHIHRRVIERRTYLNKTDTTPLSKQNYSYTITDIDSTHHTTTSVVEYRDASNLINSEKHYFFGSPIASIEGSSPYAYSAWNDGREYQVDVLNAAGITVKSEAMTWQQKAPVIWWPLPPDIVYPSFLEPANDPRIVETVTTLNESNLVSKKTSINPSTGAIGFDQFNNRTDLWEYDYGTGAPGAFLRRTHTDYQTATGYIDAQTGAHLRNLPTQQWISSDTAGANKVGLTVFGYDQTAPVDCPNIIGFDPAFTTGYTTRGNVTSVTRYTNAAAGTGGVTSTTAFDIAGNTVSTTNPRGNVSQFSYADSFSDGQLRNTYAFRTSSTSPVPDPTGQFGSNTALVTSSVYDFSTGLVTSTTDANTKTTSYEYSDVLDRLTKVNLPDGGRTTYAYVDNHQCGALVETRSLLDSTGRETDSFQFFDGLGRGSRSFTLDNQDPANPWLTIDVQYDALGRNWRVSNPYRSNGCTTAVNPSNRWTETTFDALGRQTQIKSTGDNSIVTNAYSGNTVTVTEQSGRKKRSVLNALGQITRLDEPDINGNLDVGGSPAQSTVYTYDALGNLRKVQQGAQQRFYMFDSLSRLIREKSPEQAANPPISNVTDSVTNNSQWSASYAYDADGKLTTKVDARNVTTTYAYDNLGRNTTVRYSDGTRDIDRHYDGALNGRGQFHYFNWDPNNNTRFDTHLAVDEYDTLGRIKKYRQHFYTNGVLGPEFVITRTYDLAGNVLTQGYPSGRSVSYSYDIAGRLSSFAGSIGDGQQRTYSTGITYDEFGGIRQEQFGTQAALYYKKHYNKRGQLFDVRLSTVPWATDQWNWNRGAIVNYYSSNFAWEGDPNTPAGPDNNGNILRQQHFVPIDDAISNHNYTQDTFSYDTLNRLKSVVEVHGTATTQSGQDFAQVFDYDRYGNRTINDPQTVGAPKPQFELNPQSNQEVAEPSNRLYAFGDAGRTPSQKLMRYDAAGNLIFDGFTGNGTRVYDAENRMTSAQDINGGTTVYTYDADGRRVKRNVGGVVTLQIYGVGGELLAEYPANPAANNPTKEYGYRAGQVLISGDSGNVSVPPVLTDDFNDNLLSPTNWTVYYPNIAPTVSEQSQQLQIALAPNTAGYNGVFSNSLYNLTNRTVQVESVQAVSQAGWCENFLEVELDANNYFMIQVGAGNMLFRSRVNGVNDQTSIPFDGTANRFWRIRHDQSANQVYFETSGNGSVWLTRKTVTPGFSLTALRFHLLAGAYGTGNSSPGTAKYDNFQLLSTNSGSSSLTVPNSGFESPVLGSGNFQYAPAGGSWSFANGGGISGINSAFTGVPSAAPEGVQVAFIQATGTISQSISGFQGNTDYVITFKAIQRTNCCNTSGQDIRVYIDDVQVGSFHPNSSAYTEFSTQTFTTTPGAHTIKFAGFNPLGGDQTAFLDNVRITGSVRPGFGVQWLVADHLGTPRMVVSESGLLTSVKRHDYLPFGEELFAGTGGRSQPQGYSANDDVRQKFTQKERDIETGLDYFLARYYSSRSGRFTSIDPTNGSIRQENPQSFNRYSYCLNNPLRLVDRNGKIPVEEVIDVLTLAYDFYELINHPSWTNAGFFVWDIAGTLIPYAPGSWAGRGLKWATKAEELKSGISLSREAVEWSAHVGEYGYKGLKAQGIVGKLENALEIAANNNYIRRGVALLAQGDKATRRLLAMSRMTKAADFVGVTKSGTYLIAESKGTDTAGAVEQLRSTAEALGNNSNVPKGATLVAEIVVEDINKISLGYVVQGNALYRWDDSRLVEVTVRFQGRDIQIQVRDLSHERATDR